MAPIEGESSSPDTHYISRQIVLTVSYTDQFEFPLTADEIWQRLICAPNETLSKKTFDLALRRLVFTGVLEKSGEYYCLPGRSFVVKTRHRRAQWSAAKQPSVQEFVRLIANVPWVKAVAITGSLAMSNALQKSDIDFLVVASPRRLWLTRLVLLILTSIKGKRRTTRGETPNSWCFNMWMDERNLAVPAIKRNVYSAYEVCQAQWVYDKADIPLKFYEHNSWAQQFVPMYHGESHFKAGHRQYPLVKTQAWPVTRWLTNRALDLLNMAAYVSQKLYMYPKLSRELVYFDMAYFHPRDTLRLVYTRWQHALRQSAKSKRSP